MTRDLLSRIRRDGAEPPAEHQRLDGAGRARVATGHLRLMVLLGVFTVVFTAIAGRLTDVSVLNADTGRIAARDGGARADGPGRAGIRDRNGLVLATNVPTRHLYARPRRIDHPARVARRLVAVLPSLDRHTVRAKLESGRAFVYVKRNLTPARVEAVNALGNPALRFEKAERRVYPRGRLATHLLGLTDVDNRGIAGLEQAYGERLREQHAPLRLTLDARVQSILRTELARARETFKARGAAGVVLDVDSGAVRALVSLPDYDANRPGAVGPAARFNHATLATYEMGSTFKLFNTAVALDNGVVGLRDGYDASQPLRVASYTIHDFHAQDRWLSVPEILIHSSNIASAKMARDVGTDRQRAFLADLGLLDTLPANLPELGEPQVPSPWRPINTMTIAYGHGVAVTPLHMAAGVAALVNGGTWHAPHFVKGADTPAPRDVLSPATSDKMRRLMRLVVTKGTGGKAGAPGYIVGGKTGTAEKPGEAGDYGQTPLVSSFVGAFPMHDPEHVVFVLLDEPVGTEATYGYATGGWTAAPVVRRFIERAAPLLGVAPVSPDAPAVKEAVGLDVDVRRPEVASF